MTLKRPPTVQLFAYRINYYLLPLPIIYRPDAVSLAPAGSRQLAPHTPPLLPLVAWPVHLFIFTPAAYFHFADPLPMPRPLFHLPLSLIPPPFAHLARVFVVKLLFASWVFVFAAVLVVVIVVVHGKNIINIFININMMN